MLADSQCHPDVDDFSPDLDALAGLCGETAETIARQATATFFRAFPKVARD